MKENFVAGIYNYCDRWCERCSFTSRCRNYAGTSKLSPEQLDGNNKAFWDHISSNFQQAIELLNKVAAEHGIDLNKPLSGEEETSYNERRGFIKQAAKQHPLSLLCSKYQKIVRPFLEKSEAYVNKTRELVDHLHMGMKTEEDVVYAVADVGDCFGIIQWYLYFIDSKLQRALRGKLEGEEWQQENGFQRDSDGSAKVAIIGIERSIAAWARLYNMLPLSEDVILKALSLLSQLQKKTKEEFPEAAEFKRPGFDSAN